MTGRVLSLAGVYKHFGAAEVIRGVDLTLAPGECHAVIGPNGAGKSTLFNVISGRHAPTHGCVELHGRRIDGLPPHRIHRRGLGRSFQITTLFHNMSVFENLRCALLWAHGQRYSCWRLLARQKRLNAAADAWLERLNLQPRRDVSAGLLSYAEQRMLEIGMTMAGGADVILLDEPTAGMNLNERDHAMTLIRALTADRSLLIIEHDMAVVFDLADRVSVLDHGRVLATDAPAAIRANATVQQAYLGAQATEAST